MSTQETDPRFPSGPWCGHWLQDGISGRMKLDLEFNDGRLQGEGSDPIGPFSMTGWYCVKTGIVTICKHYRYGGDVYYDGNTDPDGIEGRWHIRRTKQDGDWRIWPEAKGFELVRMEVETADGPVVLIFEPVGSETEEIGP